MGWLETMLTFAGGAANELMPPDAATKWREAVASGFRLDTRDEYCGRCGVSCAAAAVNTDGCPACRVKSLPWDRVVRLTRYTQPVSDWLISMKFHGSWRWSELFGGHLGEAVVEAGLFTQTDPLCSAVCPVPMPWRRRIHRGFDQATILAECVSRATGRPIAHLLKRKRYTKPQIHVKFDERVGNIANSIIARSVDLTGCEIVLVDDIKTSGATAAACARALRAMGAAKIGLAVIAVAESGGR